MHEAQTHDQIRLIGQDQACQLGIVRFPRGLHARGRSGLLLFVLDEVVVLGWDVGFPSALETKGVFAVRDNAHERCVEGAGGDLVDDCLEVGAVAGDQDGGADWGGHGDGFQTRDCLLM